MIVRLVVVLTLGGWALGGFVALSGLGATLWSIYAEDFWGVIQGMALVIWGVVTIQLTLLAVKYLTITFAPNGLGKEANGANS